MRFCITLLVLSNYKKIRPQGANFILTTQATLIILVSSLAQVFA